MCYELILKDEPAKLEGEWMKLSVRYKAPDEDKSKQNDYSFTHTSYTDTPDDNFKFVCSIIELSMLLHKSPYASDITLKSIIDELGAIKLDDEYKLGFKSLVEKLSKRT